MITQLLDGSNTRVTKTNMMYRAMLFQDQSKDYLVMLAENDLIAYDKPSRRFTTTDNGYQFFKRYDELIELIEPIATIAETTRR